MFLDPLLNLVFPAECVLCSNPVLEWRNGAMCSRCERGLQPRDGPCCTQCGYPAPGIEDRCGACLSGTTRYDFGRSALMVDEVLLALVHHFKYRDRVSLARPLGRRLRVCLEANAFTAERAIPVPLHRKRETERGYNQADLLARQLGLRVDSGLVGRSRRTVSQTGLDPGQRTRNVRGAFEVRGNPAGAYLLVDDIQTTGATVNELARVLRRHGATRIEVLTVGRVGLDRAAGKGIRTRS